ncbi:MAG: GNAT family N-acetyltransferase [Porphyromonadaceae bacterium]|nr:GNAT family N-acetyltransferase [Porphyromonadaceae bacterium]
MRKIAIRSRLGLLTSKRGREEEGCIRFEVQAGHRLVVLSTEVVPAYRGQGIAELMTEALLEWMRERRLSLQPLCGYTQRFVERHPEYQPYLEGYDASVATLEAFRALASEERAVQVRSFFKTAPGGYGAGDVFLGVPVPDIRRHIKQVGLWSEATVRSCLTSPYHEVRLCGFLVLVDWFARSTKDQDREQLHKLYLEHLPYCNNWDIVDNSAPTLVGKYLLDKEGEERMQVLMSLAMSGELWQERVAIVGTLGLVSAKEATEALTLARHLLPHPHDLIRKAVGWMLREVGKRISRQLLTDFLDEYVQQMSSITLSYATEHLTPEERRHYQALRRL